MTRRKNPPVLRLLLKLIRCSFFDRSSVYSNFVAAVDLICTSHIHDHHHLVFVLDREQ